MVKRHRRFSSWGSSLDDFELECDLFLQTNHKLSQSRASQVSKAFKRAAQDAARMDPSDDASEFRNARFASYLRSALDRNDNENTAITGDVTISTTGQGTDPTTVGAETLREQLVRQGEELQFLRSALKVLVHCQASERGDLHSPPNEEKLDIVKSERLVPGEIMKIPQDIQVNPLNMVVNDFYDAEDNLSDITPSEYEPGLDHFFANKATFVATTTPRHNPVTLQSFSFEIDPSYSPSLAGHTRVVAPQSKVTRQAPDDTRGKPLEISFPDMARGEIQDKRARGMRYSVYFPGWGLTSQGTYIGMLRRGQPNGSGVLRFDNRDCYIGEFRDGMLHGEGTLLLRRDGRLLKFRGRFKRNEFVGWKWPKIATESSTANARSTMVIAFQ